MKFFPFLVLLTFMSCNSQETKCNNDFNLKGRIKNVEETTKYPAHGMKYIYSLNEDDCVLLIEVYDVDSLIEKREYKYNDKVIQEIKITDSKGKEISTSNFIKNKQNQIEKVLINTSNGKSVIIQHYEENSLLSDSGKKLDKEGKIMHSWKLEYKNDLVSNQINYNPDGTIINQMTFIYNNNNDLVEFIEKNKNGEILERQYSEYQYDNKKNWIERKYYDRDKNLISTSNRKITYW